MRHHDDMTDEQMAGEVGVPVALVAWARAEDPDSPPPPYDPRFDLLLQVNIRNQVARVWGHWGLLDDTRPI